LYSANAISITYYKIIYTSVDRYSKRFRSGAA
jgi:hypothetical protein